MVSEKAVAPVLVLMGPTGVGKTALIAALAQQWPIEVISADSVQVYRYFDVGSAKPSAEVLAQCPHHLIDILEPEQQYCVAQFYQDVGILLRQIRQGGKIPVIVGGTMMYLWVLQHGLADIPPLRAEVIQSVQQRAQDNLPALYAYLQHIDPQLARSIHPHNSLRIQRGVMVFESTGQPLSSWWRLQAEGCPNTGRFNWTVLSSDDRSWLHQRVAQRVDHMLSMGWLAEVESLLSRQTTDQPFPGLRSVGYRQLVEHLQEGTTWTHTYDALLAANRQLIKRQETWMRRWPSPVTRLDAKKIDLAIKTVGSLFTNTLSC